MKCKTIVAILGIVCCAITGCDSAREAPLTLTFRHGVLSDAVLQVHNLSNQEGVEFYVYVSDGVNSAESPRFVVSPNSEKEIGRLEFDWKFKAGDEGFVHPVKYDRKLYFKLFPNGKYRTRVK